MILYFLWLIFWLTIIFLIVYLFKSTLLALSRWAACMDWVWLLIWWLVIGIGLCFVVDIIFNALKSIFIYIIGIFMATIFLLNVLWLFTYKELATLLLLLLSIFLTLLTILRRRSHSLFQTISINFQDSIYFPGQFINFNPFLYFSHHQLCQLSQLLYYMQGAISQTLEWTKKLLDSFPFKYSWFMTIKPSSNW